MNFVPKVKKFQEGGAMEQAPVEQTAPEEAAAQQQDPLMMLAEASMQALQNQDCQMAMQVCQALVQMLQQAQGGGTPAQGEPVFRKGGVLLRRIKK